MNPGPFIVREIQRDHLTTQSAYDGRAVSVQFTGNADQETQPQLEILLTDLDAEARKLGADEVVLDFSELYFMNSSCLSVLMRSIHALTTGAAKHKLRFKTNPNLRWQKRSFQALATLGQGLVILE